LVNSDTCPHPTTQVAEEAGHTAVLERVEVVLLEDQRGAFVIAEAVAAEQVRKTSSWPRT
jgi:hypothetical protein